MDPKSISETFNDYFITIGPNLAANSESTRQTDGDDTHMKYSHQTINSEFKFERIPIKNVAQTLKNLKSSNAS